MLVRTISRSRSRSRYVADDLILCSRDKPHVVSTISKVVQVLAAASGFKLTSPHSNYSENSELLLLLASASEAKQL